MVEEQTKEPNQVNDQGQPHEEKPEKARRKSDKEGVRQKLSRLEEEVNEYKDRWMRTAAEFENFKKRSARDREDWIKYSNENLLKEILSVIDSFERALDHSENDNDTEGLVDGIRMIHRQLVSTLERFGVKPIEALNRSFDPAQHEAMMQIGSAEHEPNTVLQELERGYLLHDRLLRPAKVAVSKATEN